jgi:GMP synthase (glutamine-hydrolysing)
MIHKNASSAIGIVDLGGQYCHLIARRLRDLRINAHILSPELPAEELREYAGIILSGGPSSVYDSASPSVDPRIIELGSPVLGICYGHQLLAMHLGAEVKPGAREFGLSRLSITESDSLFRDTPPIQKVWMSHSDSVNSLPSNLLPLATTERCGVAAFADANRKLFGVQFHPEVTHSEHGLAILRNFGVGVCGIRPDVSATGRLAALEEEISEKVGTRSVFFLVSGGVDSSVAFALCARALPASRMLGLYVDTGLMREGETEELQESFHRLGLSKQLRVRDESKRFLKSLEGVTAPEKKRHIIGRLFVEVQAEAMREYGIEETGWLLGQGTIYPDTIESGGAAGRAAVIKTHHNRCAEIVALLEKGQVIEPLAEFYKDEVREVGREIGLEPALTNRWPFPGPGLAIRILCNKARSERPARRVRLASEFAEYSAVRLPLKSVGVQGDGRTYKDVVALDGPLDYSKLHEISSELCNLRTSFNRIVVRIAGRWDLSKAKVYPSKLNRERLAKLRKADRITRSVMHDAGMTDSVWQFPVILIPVGRKGGDSVVLRPVNSVDGMTANFARLPSEVLNTMAERIANLPGVEAVFLDCTDKPPSTIEWE